ncbi:MAG: tRNA epoxyqueuosine(34) reductase QueG [Bryobacteraceae bacterium]|nr:tRNA epoxyqueuosine(34) reductase QueG [Bryobacteraceae bacterium]
MILEEFRALEQPTQAAFNRLARQAGFELSGVAQAAPLSDFASFRQWSDLGYAGPMGYLLDHRGDIRQDPRHLLASARSMLCLGKLYKTIDIVDPPVSRYAWGAEDYHDTLRRALSSLVEKLQSLWGPFESRICTDTAPLLERSYARQAGLGWIGRNTCLINQQQGSWFFLGEVLVSIELPPDSPPPDRCGTCRRCIDACPTQALVPSPTPSGYALDARLCISTLTIEQKGPTDPALRPATGHHLFGCDICQEVCPWNRRAPSTAEPGFQPVNATPDLDEMAALSPDDFRARFRHTPIHRAKHPGWLRNVATAMGNSADPGHRPALERLAAHPDTSVSEHARWALSQLRQHTEGDES